MDGQRLGRRESLGAANGWVRARIASRFRFRKVCGLRLRASQAATRSAGELRDFVQSTGGCAGKQFEVKLADASGDNVWWFERRDFEFPSEWRRIEIKKRQIAFAWGPTQDRTLRRIDSLEFVVAAGRGGGAGSIEIDDLRFRELPPPPTHFPPLGATASSYLSGADASAAVDGDPRTSWRSDPKAGPGQSLNVDLGMPREFGGLELNWQDGARARRYDVRPPATVLPGRCCDASRTATAPRTRCCCRNEEARFLRIDLRDGPKDGYALAELAIKDVAYGASPNAFFQALAKEPRAASTLAAFPASSPIGRSSVSMGAAKARSYPKMAHSKSGEAASRSSPLSNRARASLRGPTSPRPMPCLKGICLSQA